MVLTFVSLVSFVYDLPFKSPDVARYGVEAGGTRFFVACSNA
jgi:hypothetical protein